MGFFFPLQLLPGRLVGDLMLEKPGNQKKRSTELSLWETGLQGRETFCYLQTGFEGILEPHDMAIVHKSVESKLHWLILCQVGECEAMTHWA